MLGLLIYCIASYLHLKRKLSRTAIYAYEYKGIPVYVAEGLKTPFVLGMKKAFIYLPSSLTEQESRQCLAHEYTHICRRDHLIKFFAFCLGCIYWFNPLVWLAFHLMTKDMEMSCDEMTLKGAGIKERKAYSEILLQLSTQNQHFAGCPLAFGENSVTSRIKNILKYKKASFLVLLSCTILISVFAIALLTDPVNNKDELLTVAENTSEPDNNPLLDEKQSSAMALASQKLLEEEVAAKKLKEHKLRQELMEENIEVITVKLQVLTELYEKTIEEEEKKAINLEIISLQDLQNSLEAELDALNQELSVTSSDSFSYSNTESIQAIQVLYAKITPGKQDNSKNKISVKDKPNNLQENVTDTIQAGDIVQIAAFGPSVYTSGIQNGDFTSDDLSVEESMSYAMILYDFSKGTCKRGYVRTDNLDLNLPENTTDSYIYWISKAWCDAFCSRNGNVLYQMAVNKQKFLAWDMSDSNQGNILFGFSSPWPWGSYYISVPANMDYADNKNRDTGIYYFAETSDPSMTVWRQELTIQRDKLSGINTIDDLLNNIVDYSDIRSYDEISTAEEFKDAYLTGDFNFSFSYFNYESENYKFAASLHSDNIFRTPESALKYFLHLTDDVKTEVINYPNNADKTGSENELYIACTFKDGESVKVPMHQIDGIWYIDTSKIQQNMADYH